MVQLQVLVKTSETFNELCVCLALRTNDDISAELTDNCSNLSSRSTSSLQLLEWSYESYDCAINGEQIC